MTLAPFPPEALDELALRLLDVAAAVREMARQARAQPLEQFVLHSNSLYLSLDQLEDWVLDGTARLQSAIRRQQGAARARNLPSAILPSAKKGRRTEGGGRREGGGRK